MELPENGIDIVTTVNISLSRIADLLCTAFEGGVGYWCQIVGYDTPKNPRSIWGEDKIVKYVDYPLCGGSVFVTTDDEQDKQLNLDGTAIMEGLKIMAEKYPRHFSDFLNENEDAVTGDVFVQCCLFGEIVYE